MAASLFASALLAQDPSYRIRADLEAPLNADAGWSAAANERVAVNADAPFRLRMEAELPEGAPATALRLQARRNGSAWETLEAHDFPYPSLEYQMTFEDSALGTAPPGWTVHRGAASDLQVVEVNSGRALRARGGADGLVATVAAPWPIPEFKFGGTYLLPAGTRDGFSLVFGYTDARNHGRVDLDPAGVIRVLLIANGRETVLREEPAQIVRSTPQEVEVQYETGLLEVTFGDDEVKFQLPMTTAPVGEPGLFVPPGGDVSFADPYIEAEPKSPRVSIVSTPAYDSGEPTSDLIAGSRAPFTAGAGLSMVDRTPVWAGAGRHGEFEWPLVIRRYADGPVANEAGDVFAFRLIDAAGNPLANAPVASVTLAIPSDHLGGTFVETPGRIGPWQAKNGDLYFIMEPAESDNRFMMVKSMDGGRSWHEVDGANRPETGDLEAVEGRQVDDTIHIVHQITESVRYHAFNTSDHPSHPDSWVVRDELAAEDEALSQMATLVVRSDGSMVTVFLADQLHYAIRSPDGRWSAPVPLDTDLPEGTNGPQSVLGKDDVMHLAYLGRDGRIWYRRLLADGTLTAREQLAERAGTKESDWGAVLPLAYDEHSDTVIIAYRLDDGRLWERRVVANGPPTPAAVVTDRPVVTEAVDSQQPAADIVHDGKTVHVLFVDEDTRSIYSTNDNGGWQPPVRWIGDIQGSWVRGNIIRKADGRRVYGFVYDAGSQGGAGFNRYAEIPIDVE